MSHAEVLNLSTGTALALSPNTNSVALVRERTIPTEQQPLVGEVSANVLRTEGCRMVSAADPLRP
jgi:hypothetical protein